MGRQTIFIMEEATEKQIQNSIIDYLLLKGHFVWRNNSGVVQAQYKGKTRMWRAGVRGGSDILGICKSGGKFIAIECKKKGNTTTFIQDEFLRKIKELGGYAIIAYSIEDVEKAGL